VYPSTGAQGSCTMARRVVDDSGTIASTDGVGTIVRSTAGGGIKPLVPTDDDEKLFSEISERLEYLYQRLPSDTYTFVSTMLDQLRDQLSQDGLLEEEATQPFSSSASSFHHGSSLPGQSSLSSQSSDLLLGISPTQSATPPR
jgi:hypothetical protein